MYFYKSVFLSVAILIGCHCNRQIPIDDIQNPPISNPKDTVYNQVYQVLDGEWKGTFFIFEDTLRATKDESLLYNISNEHWSSYPIRKVAELEVNQVYKSISPYFQKVTITDYYPLEQKTIVSQGVNKVQDGQMWCVVKKPDETIIHQGSTEGKNTIIWQRNNKNPTRIEFFRETVEEDTYSIIGWGYYDGDDLSLMPKFWFAANYQRVL